MLGFAKRLESVIYYALQFSAPSKQYLQALEGKNIYIQCTDFPGALSLQFRNYSIHVEFFKHPNLEVEKLSHSQLKGPSVAFIDFLLHKNTNKATQLGLTVSGDMETSENLQRLFTTLDIDWEEILSQWIGDIPAHQMGIFYRKTKNFTNNLFISLNRNLQEYIQEEISLSPTYLEINDFMEEVDKLRLAVDRLEAKIKQLELTPL